MLREWCSNILGFLSAWGEARRIPFNPLSESRNLVQQETWSALSRTSLLCLYWCLCISSVFLCVPQSYEALSSFSIHPLSATTWHWLGGIQWDLNFPRNFISVLLKLLLSTCEMPCPSIYFLVQIKKKNEQAPICIPAWDHSQFVVQTGVSGLIVTFIIIFTESARLCSLQYKRKKEWLGIGNCPVQHWMVPVEEDQNCIKAVIRDSW